MSLATSINDDIERGGGRFVKLREAGDAIVGDLLAIDERTKTWEGQPVLSRTSGEPRKEWVITLRTELSDSDDDDGVRKIAANEGLQIAIKSHMRESGQRFPATWGGRLAVGVKVGAPSPTAQVEEWSVRYTAPTGAETINDAVAAAAPAQAADPLAGLV